MRHDRSRTTPGTGSPPVCPTVPVLAVRTRWRLRRQDRTSALTARRHGALGVLMSAERLADVAGRACRPDASDDSVRTDRVALDVLWRTLHRDAARSTAHWNPGAAHLRQAADVRRWGTTASRRDVATLLVNARRVAADELDAARRGRRTQAVGTAGDAVPSL